MGSPSEWFGERGFVTKVLVTLTALFAVIGTPVGVAIHYENEIDDVRREHNEELDAFKHEANELYVSNVQFKGFIQRDWKSDLIELKIRARKESDPELRDMLAEELEADYGLYCTDYPSDSICQNHEWANP